MQRQRINFDLNHARNRMSQRTHEASLIVGKTRDHHEIRSSSNGNIFQTRLEGQGHDSSASLRNVERTGSTVDSTTSLLTEPVQLSVRFHESRTSTQDVILDPKLVPGIKDGTICELESLEGVARKFYFTFRMPDVSLAGLGTNSFISLQSGPIQQLLDLKLRSQVLVRVKTQEAVEADVAEIYVKDMHLSRGDMWNLSSLLTEQCLYRSQKLSFLHGSIRATVGKIYRNGRKVFSGYIGNNTKVVFRSESARLIVFIQISSEMWHFEESGQQMFNKLVNSLLPRIFQRWKDLGTHHLITIVLFSSVDLNTENTQYRAGELSGNRKDYYRVVVDQVSILLWNEIMAALRRAFASFSKDTRLQKNPHRDQLHPEEYVILGNFLPSVKGNLLEAINLGMSLISDDFRDPDLRHTTNHFLYISPGTGIFDTNYDMLVQTSKLMSTIDSTIDVLCLSQPPLHVVPLVRYLDNQKKLKHCIPSWMDISFWSDSTQAMQQWLPRCKIYELQMMGVMENELSAINVSELSFHNSRSIQDAMDDYDKDLFSTKASATLPKKTASRSKQPMRSISAGARSGFQPPELSTFKASSPTTSNVVGVTTTSKSNVSAFSSLLSITKTETKKTSPNAFEFVKRIISSPGVKSVSVKNDEDVPKLDTISVSDHSPRINKMVSDSALMRPSIRVRKNEEREKTGKQRHERQERSSLLNSFWTQVENPSNAVTSELISMVSYGRWQFVFPQNVKRKNIKWKSISTPASLPLMTPIFPSVSDFNQNFTFRIYDVFLSQDDVNERRNSQTLMCKMISLRLTLGFQICVADNVAKVENQRKPNGDSKLLIQYLTKKNYLGSRIYLSLSNEIHRISCDFDGLVNVQVYKRMIRSDDVLTHSSATDYVPYVRTRYSRNYSQMVIQGLQGEPRNYNWNQLDQLLAGYEEAVEPAQRKSHRIKFVILPTEIPSNAFNVASEKLTPEEIRLEGIRSLISIINRLKYRTEAEKKERKKVEIIPEINFYTGNLFSYLDTVSAQLTGDTTHALFQNTRFDQKVPLAKLARAIEGDEGIRVADRKWHLRTHPNCFVGSDLVSWMIENFEDIDTREQAVEYGNKLMDQGLFRHVESRHRFLDGHYFYELLKETEPATVSSPSTLSTTDRIKNPESVAETADEDQGAKKRVVLSRKVTCDLDPNRLSWQPELVTVHYDIVHNPEHCFHVRLEWLNNTSKLVEDTVNSWAKHCERYGLTLVEAPWQELCTLPTRNPLHSTVDISLALDPWTDPEFDVDILKENVYFFHLCIMEKSGFLLDNRTATYFRNDNFDVVYSWGKPTFKYAQFIHKTGAYIAELRENGGFFLAPNNAHVARVNLSVSQQAKNKAVYLDSQGVMLDFMSTCQDAEKLRELFREALERYEVSKDMEYALFDEEFGLSSENLSCDSGQYGDLSSHVQTVEIVSWVWFGVAEVLGHLDDVAELGRVWRDGGVLVEDVRQSTGQDSLDTLDLVAGGHHFLQWGDERQTGANRRLVETQAGVLGGKDVVPQSERAGEGLFVWSGHRNTVLQEQWIRVGQSLVGGVVDENNRDRALFEVFC
ncbi:hypothetical protein OGAPHI_005160 [Ogataea philodendri]|uniref:Vacuolar membrane-associated protein IML1 n=1 Tax=Ogataea philodendri TaxID=1378263 RepID=A0A9P8P0T9_9ASCO|nr:uncharacterized protein OGAPHI_005160 [Ogataea philodendri]KAH3663758.1 hypothetical protein OGAPHI_005160 [Ogataea philodendri]